MLLILIVFITLPLLYIIIKKYKYWEKKGVPGPKPLPLIGNIGVSILGQKNVSDVYADIYHKFEDCPFVGVYRMGQPCLLIRDPEIIKNVLIKDVSCFMEKVDRELDPLISRNTFIMKGDEWKRARQFMTPNFASGKIKAVFPIAEGVSKNLVSYLEEQDVAVNAKEAFIKFSCDVIAAYGYGMEGNSFKDPNAELMTLAKKFATPETLRLHPPLAQLSKICAEQYTMTSTGNNFRNISVTLEKGSSIVISLLGLHTDARYFPSPNEFIPERFLDKAEANKNVYMPFGAGPRMCIGSF
ncbi:cytochrome P450 6k1-like [Anoplophora glabripennis]|uniref:cytochrome P450 6k1-like n=1 Tax=Anoplophora glabripennis TaxID=217634 RepID=UPI000874DFF3|nr:cytochrome P450 6k1-like [Anoplophora glabripennis]